jgi:glycosyltransferase involved in cell wall biosynthesis
LRAELGIGPEEFVVGTIGRLDPIKNHTGLIRAVRLLHESGKDVRLVIVGNGPERASIENYCLAAKLDPAPIMLGYRSDTPRLYRMFDSFVLNSFAEGMSNTLLEAMSSGLAVVCTKSGGNTEVITDQERGRLVGSGDDESLAQVLSELTFSESTRKVLGTNARNFVLRNLSVSRMVDGYAGLYQSMAG